VVIGARGRRVSGGLRQRLRFLQLTNIRLTPAGKLHWDAPGDTTEDARLVRLHKRFDADWREGLFLLAAEKADTSASPTLRYWQGIAEALLTRLCHLSPEMTLAAVEPLTDGECTQWVLTAPPMSGGEYLSAELLVTLWDALLDWCGGAAATEGVQAFLAERAPKWHQVGRVCFHLAENKSDPERPFAFMASYVSGLGASGQARHLPLGKALEQYAGAKNRAALIKLLAPVQAASERCDWVKTLVDSGAVYQPTAWTADRAYRLLRSVPDLEDSGLMVRLPDWWRRRPRPQVSVTVGDRKPSRFGIDAVLDFDVAVALGDERLSRGEIEALLSGGDGLVLFKGQWVEVDREKLREAIAHWESLREEAQDGGISFIEGMRLLAGATPDLGREKQADTEREWVHVEAGGALRDILSGLRDPARLGTLPQLGLQATLRPYQENGAAWLRFLTELGLGACLADDMGLGKTIQVLALLLQLSKTGSGPSLLVVPASLLGNWRAEAQRFAPSLRLAFLHPSETDAETLGRIEESPVEALAAVDLAVSTYSMLARQKWLYEVHWRLVIIDEAQAIKNPGTGQTRAVKKLPALARVALTGTPVENRLGDLWSIFDFLNPGLLGSAKTFKSFVEDLQARATDQYAPLRRLVAPYILRRLKTDRTIINDLPDKVETTRFCNLTKAQVRLYEQVVGAMKTALEAADGMKRRALVLQTLMRLKQVCNHPSQLSGDGVYAGADSGKFLRIKEICEELAERQERVLVFTQFREIIDPLAGHLAGIFGRGGLVLHGDTSIAKRNGLVDQFQREDGPPFMILSLKAGGTGLNLTAASQVIHFDRWWNPAVEDQATDRAFRIGQRRNVLVHKFVTSGSVEEKIDLMIAEKRQLAAELLSGGGAEVDLTTLNDTELMDLVRLDIRRASA
jgi:non-specific serine/threonine protein kinase